MTELEKIRSVVSRFFNVTEAEVTDGFIFPSERMQSSVARSTLYAALKRLAGVDLPSVFKANTFGQLVNGAPAQESEASRQQSPVIEVFGDKRVAVAPAIGIDIEHADNLPAAGDPWSAPFYGEHFTAAEIAHCTRQSEPRLSFCGIWAAKEAAIKCGLFAGARLNDLTIEHDGAGKPRLTSRNPSQAKVAEECMISISHSRGTAVAVCAWVPTSKQLLNNKEDTSQMRAPSTTPAKQVSEPSRRLAWVALVFSVVAITVWAWRVAFH